MNIRTGTLLVCRYSRRLARVVNSRMAGMAFGHSGCTMVYEVKEYGKEHLKFCQTLTEYELNGLYERAPGGEVLFGNE